MPKVSRPPVYSRQKEIGRSDRAYVFIAGRSESYSARTARLRATSDTPKLINEKPADKGRRSHYLPSRLPTTSTVAMLMAAYLEYAIGKYGERGPEVVHLRSVFRMLRRLCGALPAKDFGPKRFKQLRAIMICEGWSRTYIRDQCGRVKRMVAWGVSEEVLPPHARHALDAVVGLAEGEAGVRETAEVEAVPDAVVEATLKHLGQTARDMVAIQRLTGMRPGELCQLAAQHIDRKNQVWLFRPPKHKTKKRGKKRVIAIGPRAQAILQKYLFSTPCFPYTTASYRRHVARGCDRAFPHPAIAAIQASDLRPRAKMLAIAARKRAIKAELAEWRCEHKWHPHQIRHSAAEEIRETFGLEHAQHVLGHAHADMTEHYAKGNVQKAVEVALRIG